MKLWGVAMVRNEEDIVEAFVRHNLGVLDGLVIVDHGSADRTRAIIAALCGERLPIVVLRSDAVGYLQAEITTAAARDAFGRFGADAVVPLDADEFLWAASRDALERAIADVPPGHYAEVDWPSFAPPENAGGDIVRLLRGAVRLPPSLTWPSQYRSKVLLTRTFAADPQATLRMGNHGVILGRHQKLSPAMPHVRLPGDVVEIRHVPVRSESQFVVKITVKRLARVAAGRDYPSASKIRGGFDELRRGDPLTWWRTLDAARSSIAAGSEDDAPIGPGMALRYTAGAPADPLPLVLAAVEDLARRFARTRRGDGTETRQRSPA